MSDQADAIYEEIGRNWTGVLEFARSMGFELSEVQFKHSNGNVVNMPFDKLQSSQGVSLLRTLLIGARAISKNQL